MAQPVEIYVKFTCPFCHRAIALLDKKGVSYDVIDINKHPDRRPEMIDRADGRTTVPQIFINGDGVGGCDDLYALDAAGKLDSRLGLATG